jgi:hypothetical protein
LANMLGFQLFMLVIPRMIIKINYIKDLYFSILLKQKNMVNYENI